MLYAVVGPLMLGHATTFHEGAFTVESTVRIIADRQSRISRPRRPPIAC